MAQHFITARLIRDIWILSLATFAGVLALIAFIIGRRIKRDRDFKVLDLFRSESAATLEALLSQTTSGPAAAERFQDMMRPAHREAVERILLEMLAVPRYAALAPQILEDLGLVRAWQRRLANQGASQPRQNEKPIRPLQKLHAYGRAKSAENLGRIRHRESWPLLVNALSDRSGEVRAVALRSLGALAEPRSFASLIECVRANVNSGRPEFSERSLRSALTGFPPEVAAELLPVLQDPNPRLRELAARILRDMLGNRGHALAPQLASCIMDQLARDPSEEVRALAAGLLEFVAPDDQEAARRIIELTGDREWIVRLHAVRTLASCRDPGCLARLSALASDRHWRVREAAVHGLALCGSAGVDAALDLLLSTRDAYAAEQIAEELKASGALATLAARSPEPGHERDAEALKKLMRIGAAGAAQAVSGDGAGREKVFAEAPKRLAAIAGASAASPPSLQKESPRSETP